MLLSLQGCTEKAIKKPTDILFTVPTCHIITARQQWPVTLTAAAARLGGVGDPRARWWWWWWPVAGVQRPGAGTVHGARYRPDTSPAYSEEFNLVFIEIQLELCQRSSAAAAHNNFTASLFSFPGMRTGQVGNIICSFLSPRFLRVSQATKLQSSQQRSAFMST